MLQVAFLWYCLLFSILDELGTYMVALLPAVPKCSLFCIVLLLMDPVTSLALLTDGAQLQTHLLSWISPVLIAHCTWKTV